MTNVVHLWNVSKFIEKIQNPEVAKLQMHYVRCCRELGDTVDLPRQNFGPAVLCPSCGSAWATTTHKTRVSPRRLPPGRIETLIRLTQDTGVKLPKHQRTLACKSAGNKTNKIVKICSVCSSRATFSLSKPERKRKLKAKLLSDISDLKLSSKKRKKRTKDKAAGLNLSGIFPVTPVAKGVKDSPQSIQQTPLLFASNKKISKPNTPASTLKPQKMDLSKLQSLFSTNVTPSKKNKLSSFLQAL